MKTKDKIPPDYTPDKWVIVKIKQKHVDQPIYKVLAGWYGGYMFGDEWRASSGITKVVKKRDKYYIYNESGSIYECYKKCEGFNSLTSDIFGMMKKRLASQVEHVNMDEYLKDLYNAKTLG